MRTGKGEGMFPRWICSITIRRISSGNLCACLTAQLLQCSDVARIKIPNGSDNICAQLQHHVGDVSQNIFAPLSLIHAPLVILEKFTQSERGEVLLDFLVDRAEKIEKDNAIHVLHTLEKSLTDFILHRQLGSCFRGTSLASMRCISPLKPKLLSLS
ncbi:unnamed protein product [Trypanosoma congolense IL3000]|uniref:WGS project CAEQ00000000 data, annotated contig 148 n=1 Tax=Trypanosoma congolense (strain IL3000) TaxID=1068625 RepID=F9W6L6_TRYCI|nr:unnamed protein product [Trypanosoma congolense IL3000]